MPHAGALANFRVLTLARPLSLNTRFVYAKRFVECCRNGLPKTKAEQGWDRTTDHVRYAFLRFGIENKVIIERLKASGFSVGKDARATGTRAVHVMAGNSSGPRARAAFVANLTYACAQADGITILIEPLNPHNAPGYYLNSTGLAADIIREVGQPNLRLMFDCYHVQIIEGDVTRRLTALLPLIGHIQIASAPDRDSPDHGELDYAFVLRHIADLGWTSPIGAEYHPGPRPDFAWLTTHRILPQQR